MSLQWTEADFQRVAHNTKLGERTKEACRSVLVDGVSGVDAAAKHKVFAAQISRGLATLRERKQKMVQSAVSLQENTALLRFTAGQVAKAMFGEGLVVEDAQPGKQYEGPVVVNSHGFVVQKVGRSGVVHDLGNLDKLPVLNSPLTISYPKGSGQATVTQLELRQGSKELGR